MTTDFHTRGTPSLTTAQMDRAIGTLLGTAAGDALGAGYEFRPRLEYTKPITMSGGGPFGFAAGEWTDDTSMAFCIAEVAATGVDLLDATAQDEIVAKWVEWAKNAPDVGNQTRAVLGRLTERTAAQAKRVASDYANTHPHSAGNGSLMRTAPVVLSYLDSPTELWQAAREISNLTHADPDAADACGLWCLAMRDAILTGEMKGPRVGLEFLDEDRRELWAARIDEAESKQAWEFTNNGWVVHAFQAAWSAIVHTPIPADLPELAIFPAQHFRAALERAARVGNDTDTVAAIAGGLLGARWGHSAVPSEWLAILHGFPNARTADLVRLAVLTFQRGQTDSQGWPNADRLYHPTDLNAGTFWSTEYEPNLILGEQCSLGVEHIPFDAVVSLSRLGANETPVQHPHQLSIRVMDSDDREKNLHLDFQYFDVALQLRKWLDEGRKVFLHCVHTHNRTPNFLAAFLMHCHGLSSTEALREVTKSLPMSMPHGYLSERLERITPRNLKQGSDVYVEFTFLADSLADPAMLYATAQGKTLARQHGVWVEVESLPVDLVLVSAAAIADIDEKYFSNRL